MKFTVNMILLSVAIFYGVTPGPAVIRTVCNYLITDIIFFIHIYFIYFADKLNINILQTNLRKRIN